LREEATGEGAERADRGYFERHVEFSNGDSEIKMANGRKR